MLGANILELNPSAIEVYLVSNQGFWLLATDEELFLSYEDFPWFKDATIAQVTNVERPSADHLYWPSLDIDLSLESVRDPSKFPLISKIETH
jgi:hypothetical protein